MTQGWIPKDLEETLGQTPKDIDYVVVESTYGDKTHKNPKGTGKDTKFEDIRGKVIGMSYEHTVIQGIKVPVTLYKVEDKNGDIHRGVAMRHSNYPTLGSTVEMQLEDTAFMLTLDQGKMARWHFIEKLAYGKMLNEQGK